MASQEDILKSNEAELILNSETFQKRYRTSQRRIRQSLVIKQTRRSNQQRITPQSNQITPRSRKTSTHHHRERKNHKITAWQITQSCVKSVLILCKYC